MNKKLLIGLGIGITTFLLIDKVIYADGLEEELLKYLQDDSFDLFGRKLDKILFQNINKYHIQGKLNDAELKAKLQFIIEDIKTMPLQWKCINKMLSQEENSFLYASLGNIAAIKYFLGPEKFGELFGKIIKMVVK